MEDVSPCCLVIYRLLDASGEKQRQLPASPRSAGQDREGVVVQEAEVVEVVAEGVEDF